MADLLATANERLKIARQLAAEARQELREAQPVPVRMVTPDQAKAEGQPAVAYLLPPQEREDILGLHTAVFDSAASRANALTAESGRQVEEAILAFQVHLELEAATNKFRPWQQIPAWVVGAAAVTMGFVLLFVDLRYPGFAWAFAALLACLAAVLMYRSKAKVAVGTGGDSSDDQKASSEPPEVSTQ